MEELGGFRSEFPITDKYTFLNHAAISPPPVRVGEAVESLFREFSYDGIACYPKWEKRVEEVRHLFAELIGAAANEIAFVGNTSEGLSTVAAGLEWKKGDGVLVTRPDFPTNIYPWMNLERHGVQVHFIERSGGRFGIGEVDKALKPGCKLLSVSSVDFASGFYCDLEALGEFCHRKGLLFCVDGIQSLGVIPMDVRRFRIHFLASGGHKWLLSTLGCGALFVSKEAGNLIHPERVGWKSVIDEEDFFRLHFDLKPDALRFEPGTMNVAGIYALGAAVELLLEVGVGKIYEHVLGINDLLFQGLKDRKIQIASPMGEKERSGILSFIPLSDLKSLYRFFSEERIMVSLRDNMIRLSPHFYNNLDDVNRFLEAFEKWESL